MRPKLFSVLVGSLTLFMVSPAGAQFPLQSAEGTSGLLNDNGAGLFSDDASKTRVGIKANWGESNIVQDPNTGQIGFAPLSEWILDAGFAANKGKRDLFKGGSFTPGMDVSLTFSHTREQQISGFNQFFGRVTLDTVERKLTDFGMPDAQTSDAEMPDLQVASLTTDTGVSLGFGGGYNHAFSEAVIWGASATLLHRWNSEGDRNLVGN